MIPDKWKRFLNSKKGGWIFVAAAVLGMILIYISTRTGTSQEKEQPDTAAMYAEQVEAKLKTVVSRITGEDDPEVFVTLEGSEEVVYADMVDKSNDHTENREGESNEKKQEKSDSKQNYILVEEADGSQRALVVTTLSPSVRGVVIVSAYADDPTVREKVVEAVTTSLNIPSKKVCVVGVCQVEEQ